MISRTSFPNVQNPIVRISSHNDSTWGSGRSSFSRRAFLKSATLVTSAAALPSIAFPQESVETAIAEITETNTELHQKVVDFSAQALNELKPALLSTDLSAIRRLPDSSIHWNNLCSSFRVADSAGIDLDENKKLVLIAGLHNPNIPSWVIHESIYTAGKYAEHLNSLDSNASPALEKKKEMFKILLDYLDRKIVPEEVVGYSLAQLSDQGSIDEISKSFIQSSNQSNRENLLNILIYAHQNPSIKLGEDLLSEIQKDLNKVLQGYEHPAVIAGDNSNNTGDSEKDNSVLLSNKEGIYVAKELLVLARSISDIEAFSTTVNKYFDSKPSDSYDTDADYCVLKALIELSTKYPEEAILKNSIKDIALNHPKVFFDAYLCANATSLNSPQAEAGREITKLFNSNPGFGREVLVESLNSNSPVSAERKSKAIQVIASLNSLAKEQDLIKVLRSISKDKNEKQENRIAAMRGLGRIKDDTCIESLLEISADVSSTAFLRGEALYTALLIDTPDFIPKEFEELANSDRAFGLEMYYFNPEVNGDVRINPITFKPLKVKTSKPEDSMITRLAETLDQKYGGKSGKLESLSQNKKEKYFEPLIKYLESTCKLDENGNLRPDESITPLDFDIAIPAIYALSHAGIGSSTLAKIAKSPWNYVKKSTSNQIFVDASRDNLNESFLRVLAIQGLGGAIDISNPEDPGIKILSGLVENDSASVNYMESLVSWFQVSDRFEKAIKGTEGKRERFEDSRKIHVNALLKFFKEDIIYDNEDPIINLRDVEKRRFLACSSLVKLGATKELIDLAYEQDWVNKRNENLRLIFYAMKSNGVQESDIEKLGLDKPKEIKELFDFITNDRAFFGTLIDEYKLDGEGVEIAVVDGGIPMFFGDEERKDNIVYQSEMFGPSAYDLKSKHARTVTRQLAKLPKLKVHPFTWDNITSSQDPLLPNNRFDPVILAFENLIEGKLLGKNNVSIIDMSFGLKSPGMANEEPYINYVNRRAAMGHLANDLGLGCNVSVGNDRGVNPTVSRNMEYGEVNALMSFVTHKSTLRQANGVFRTASFDSDRGKFIKTSGTQDPLHESEVDFIGVHGVTLANYRRRGIEAWEIYPATSFAVPNKGVLDAMVQQMLTRRGEEFNAVKHNKMVSDTCDEHPRRKRHEGWRSVNPERLFKEYGFFNH